MAETTKVLVATDLSDWAQKAETRGAIIAKTIEDGQMDLVYIQENASTDFFSKLMPGSHSDIADKVGQRAQEKLAKRAEKVAGEQGIAVNPIARVGDVTPEVQSLIREKAPDILVMGKHGHGYQHTMPILGNTPFKIVHGCPCPVLVVQNEPEQPYKRVLMPIDFSEGSAYQVKQALPFIPKDAEVVLIHVCQPATEMHQHFGAVSLDDVEMLKKHMIEEIQAEMKKFIAALGIDRAFSVEIKVGPAHRAILDYVKEANIDLLVLGKKPHNLITDYIIGTMVHTGLNKAACDVLVTPSMG